MFYYAQLNEENICISISGYGSEMDHEILIAIESENYDYLWRKYENGEWSEEKFKPEPQPQPPSEIDLLKARIATLEEHNEEHEAAIIDLAIFISEKIGDGE